MNDWINCSDHTNRLYLHHKHLSYGIDSHLLLTQRPISEEEIRDGPCHNSGLAVRFGADFWKITFAIQQIHLDHTNLCLILIKMISNSTYIHLWWGDSLPTLSVTDLRHRRHFATNQRWPRMSRDAYTSSSFLSPFLRSVLIDLLMILTNCVYIKNMYVVMKKIFWEASFSLMQMSY